MENFIFCSVCPRNLRNIVEVIQKYMRMIPFGRDISGGCDFDHKTS